MEWLVGFSEFGVSAPTEGATFAAVPAGDFQRIGEFIEADGGEGWRMKRALLAPSAAGLRAFRPDENSATARTVAAEFGELVNRGLFIYDIQKIRNFICWKREIEPRVKVARNAKGTSREAPQP